MFSLFRSKQEIMSRAEKKRLVKAIKEVESKTSGEVRVYIEGASPTSEPMERCVELFQHLNMHKTALHNAVLIYIATKDRKYAIFGDQGIYEKAGADYWQQKASVLVEHLRKGEYADGIEKCILGIGASLAQFYPPVIGNKNELPDDILFGKF
jgi:uncharacterized membrane protein